MRITKNRQRYPQGNTFDSQWEERSAEKRGGRPRLRRKQRLQRENLLHPPGFEREEKTTQRQDRKSNARRKILPGNLKTLRKKPYRKEGLLVATL